MPVRVKDEGRYELFETDHGHRILVLDGERWYAWIEGQESPILVHTDSDHRRDHTIQEGRFYFVDFEEDPTFKDMPHLFLQRGEEFQEFLLPNGFPTERDAQKRFVVTDETLSEEKLHHYLMHPAPAGPGESRMDRPGGGSMANVAHHLRGIDLPADRERIRRHARENDAPQAVLDQLDRLPEGRRFESMADVMEGIGDEEERGGREEERGGDREVPIANFDEMSVDDASGQLGDLSEDELRRLRRYEQSHKDRKTMIQAIDRQLGK